MTQENLNTQTNENELISNVFTIDEVDLLMSGLSLKIIESIKGDDEHSDGDEAHDTALLIAKIDTSLHNAREEKNEEVKSIPIDLSIPELKIAISGLKMIDKRFVKHSFPSTLAMLDKLQF